jgi:hypothetical protein
VRVYIGGLTNNLKRIYIKFVTRRTLEGSTRLARLTAKTVDVGGREQLAVRYLSLGSQKPGTALRFPLGVATSPDPFSLLILSQTPRCGGEAEALGINSSASPQRRASHGT